MKKSYRYIIETIIICIILITAVILLYSKNEAESQRIYPGNSINIANYSFEFDLITDRAWGAGYGALRVLFQFSIHVDLLENTRVSFELISIMVNQGNDDWKDGTVVDTNETYYDYYRYTVGRIDGPLWECGSQLTVIADIACDLDDNIVYHVEEESTVNCWG